MDFNINNYLSNLSTINKDFNSLWAEILDTVPKLTPNWLPGEANESDPLVVLLKELAIVGDKLNYNIDKNTLEQFPDLLTQLRTAYSVFRSMGYNPRWYKSATTQITITYNGGVGEDILSGQVVTGDQDKDKIVLKRFTSVADDNSENVYTLLENATFTPGQARQASVIAIEGTVNDFEVNGDTQIKINNLDSQNRLYFVQPNVAQNGIFIDFDPNFSNISLQLTGSTQELEPSDSQQGNQMVWKRVDNLYQHLPGSYVYRFGIDPSTGTNYIQFPEDIGTLIDKGIYIKYILSSGSRGNIKTGTITQLYGEPTFDPITITKNTGSSTETVSDATPSKSNFTARNLASTQNGQDPETIEEMQQGYERVVGTFSTLVTLRDYSNYIYNATDSVGRHLVSNIKVSDRGNDLYDHLTYRSLGALGAFTAKSAEVPRSLGGEGQEEIMTAYNLRLYPLQNTSTGNINSLNDFNRTFEVGDSTVTSTTGGVATIGDRWVSAILDSVQETKTINHDFMNYCGAPVFLDYDIEGQIYLQKVVSNAEALEIKQAVDLAIYRSVNSRELVFGEKINYPKLVEIVKNADPRIQYVALNPITYHDPDTTLLDQGDYDVTARSVISGATPWAVLNPETADAASGFSSFTFPWFYAGKDNAVTFYGKGESDTITSVSPVVAQKWTSLVERSNPTDPGQGKRKFVVQKNETFSILTPAYITKTTYTNFFYAKYVDTNEEEESVVKVIQSGAPVQLGPTQSIYIYETKDGKGERAVLKGGDIVLFTGDSTTTQLENNVMVSLGTKLSVSELEEDTSFLQNSRLSADARTINDANYQVRIASNSVGLKDYLELNPSENTAKIAAGYTLNIGEYLLFTDFNRATDDSSTPVLEVGIIGEGNTIVVNYSSGETKALLTSDQHQDKDPTKPVNTNWDGNFLINSIDITEGNYGSVPYVPIPSRKLQYTTNTIYNFGEGYTLTGFDSDEDDYSPTQVFPITVGDQISYEQEGGEKGTIPKPIGNKGYKMSCQLALLLTADLSQDLVSTQAIILNGGSTIISAEKQESGAITTTVQATATLIYPGGQPLALTESEQAILKLMTYTDAAGERLTNIATTTGFWLSVPAEGLQLPDPKKGGASGSSAADIEAYLFAFLDGQANTVHYAIAKPNEAITAEALKEIHATDGTLSLSELVLGIRTGSMYYDGKEWTSVVSELLEGETKLAVLGEQGKGGLLYTKISLGAIVDSNSPLYVPSDNIIFSPKSAESFFLANHPCNEYVLPRLHLAEIKDNKEVAPLQNLKISSLSIRS